MPLYSPAFIWNKKSCQHYCINGDYNKYKAFPAHFIHLHPALAAFVFLSSHHGDWWLKQQRAPVWGSTLSTVIYYTILVKMSAFLIVWTTNTCFFFSWSSTAKKTTHFLIKWASGDFTFQPHTNCPILCAASFNLWSYILKEISWDVCV